MLKYLLIVAIQYDLNGLINIQYYCDYTNTIQVMSCCNMFTPVRQVSTDKMQGCLFTGAMSVHCRTLSGISFLLNLPE
jgi:hypothetical protein